MMKKRYEPLEISLDDDGYVTLYQDYNDSEPTSVRVSVDQIPQLIADLRNAEATFEQATAEKPK